MTKPRKAPEPKGIPSLRAYLATLESAEHEHFAVRAQSRVSNEDAFSEMKDHVLGLYQGVDPVRSFVDETGAIFDCIPVEQQPALRGSKDGVPKAPDLPPIESPGASEKTPQGGEAEMRANIAGSPLSPNRKDWHGNIMHCPQGTIPMRRITLEDVTRFPTLRAFMRKGPGGAGRPPRAVEPDTVPATHRWAHAYQGVTNGGGHSFLNLWRPSIGANQVFSLSQHWYVGGSGGNLQTAECGWQVYPDFYHDAQPHLFCYWTADDYQTTGCYNLTCNKFVQTSSSFSPGMALGPISIAGGQQYQIELAYWHANGRWWLYMNGTQGTNAIGYYPDTLYGNGALKTAAAEIDYGGETVGTTSFPAMGSGAFANQGWQHAAYQSAIGYWPPAGGALVNANLTASQAWPGCYTAQTNLYGAPWSETLWFGGPGGNC
jgi:Neprosin/Neprosin activation peptide